MSINTKRAADKPLVSLCCSTHSRPDLFPEALAGMLQQSVAAVAKSAIQLHSDSAQVQ